MCSISYTEADSVCMAPTARSLSKVWSLRISGSFHACLFIFGRKTMAASLKNRLQMRLKSKFGDAFMVFKFVMVLNSYNIHIPLD